MDPGPFAPVKPPDLFGVRARRSLLWTGNERYEANVPPAERIARNGLLVPWVQVHPLLGKPVPDESILGRLDRHGRMAELLVEAAPPPAPLPSSRGLHERGRVVFEETCARCHGTYRQEEVAGRLATTVASYEEELVPVDEVGTDPAYDASQDEEFNRRVRATAIGKLYAETRTGHTYVARPLLGARLRFPYLHNASVPSLRALLEPPERRPATFWVGADAPLDEEGCGYGAGEPRGPRAQRRDTSLDGNRARGHSYGTTLGDEEKKALVAYVKSL
jgi:mono/diheme cytochrome c family protein